MKNLYILELSEIFDKEVRLPYSTGVIWSYCKQNEVIKNNYNLKEWFYRKESPANIIEQIVDPDVMIVSSFVWNWEFNKKIAREVKEVYPNCITIFGGPMVPTPEMFKSEGVHPYWECTMDNWFDDYPYIDIVCHGEGELTIEEILLECLKDNQFSKIKGCTTKNHSCMLRERISNIDSMPSPYLDGTFDEFIEKYAKREDFDFELTATFELVRGCPYSCTFCETGNKYYSKLEKQTIDKVKKEIDWVVKHKIEYIYETNSNFGLYYEADMEIAKYLVECNKQYGYPKRYRVDWAKSRADKCLEIAKVLNEVELYKGVTIALQSLDKTTTKYVKRKNIDDGDLKKTLDIYNEASIQPYIDLILGLPGETKDTFINGLYDLMNYGHHGYVSANPLEVLPNTPFSDKNYIELHDLKIIETMPQTFHFKIDPETMIKTKVVVSTKYMPYEDYVTSSLYRWLLLSCHFLGPTQFIARYFNDYKNYYDGLYEWIRNNPDTLLGKELIRTEYNLRKTLTDNTHPWGRIIPEVCEYAWEYEEATNYYISKNREQFYSELMDYRKVPDQVLKYQIDNVVDPEVEYDGDYYSWMKKCLWWGRKNSAFLKTMHLNLEVNDQ